MPSTPFFAQDLVTKALVAVFTILFAFTGLAQSLTEVSGTVSGQWTRERSPYLIVNDAVVAEGQTLEVEAGVTVLFRDADDDLFINGTLMVNGTANEKVRFSTDNLTPAPGQWGAIVLSEGSDNSLIEHAIVEYGGGFRGGQFIIEDASPTLADISFVGSRSAGLEILGGTPLVRNARFSENQAYAATATVAAFPVFTNLAAENNGHDAIGRHGGTLSASGNWPPGGIPYTLINDITIPQDIVLSIGAGSTIQFQDTDDDLWIQGGILAEGTPDAPIRFTSNETEKAPGQWGAILVSETADTNSTVFQHCLFDSGGGFRSELLQITGVAAHISQCQFHESRLRGITLTSSQSSITDCLFNNNLGYAVGMDVSSTPTWARNSAKGNGKDAIAIFGGTLQQAGQWNLSSIPYTIINDVTVAQEAKLTIAAGNTIQFQDRDDDLWINGALEAIGTESTPIRFTSNELEKAPDQWGALIVNEMADDTQTVFQYCIFECGGGFRGELLQINDASPLVSHSQFRLSRLRGITLTSSQSSITDCRFTDNRDYALGMDVSSVPIWARNNASGNGKDAFAIFGGTLQQAGQWNFSSIPYTIINDITVAPDTKLTVSAGNIIQFQDTDDDLWINGALEAIGSPTEPIRFTSDDSKKAPGQWGAIMIGETATSHSTRFSHCQFEYGGGFRESMLHINQAAPSLTQCTFSSSRLHGLTLERSTAIISHCHFQNNVNHAFVFDPPSFPNNSGNSAAGNGANSIGILGGSLTGHVVWLNDTIPYTIHNDITVTEEASLTVQPGTTVQFRDTDDDLFIAGSLVARGTIPDPIRFTSDDSEKAPGQWGAIIFQDTANDTSTSLQHLVVQYGAGFRSGMVEIHNSLPEIEQVEFHHSRSHGIAVLESNPRLEQLVFRDNQGSGIHTSNGAKPTIQFNTFTRNSQAGVTNADRSQIIEATNNYWGDPSGPKDTRNDDELNQLNEDSDGDAVSEYVRWQPFLAEPPNAQRPQSPRIATNPTRTDFGAIEISQAGSQTIRVSNQGDAELIITSLSISPDSFRTAVTPPISIAPQATIDLPVSFHPQLVGEATGSIAIVSTDSSEPSLSVALTGIGIDPDNPTEPTEPTLPMEPGTIRRITFDSNNETTPVWHPADNRIAFATNRTAGQYNDLGMVNADGTDERLIASGPQLPFGIAPFGISWVGDTDLLMTTETVVFHEYMSFDTRQAPFIRAIRDGDDAAFRRRLLVDGGGGGELFTVSRDGSTALWRFSTRGGAGDYTLRSAPFNSLTGQSARSVGTIHISGNRPAGSTRHIFGAGLFSDGSEFLVSLPNGEGYDLYRYSTTQSFDPIQVTTTGGSSGMISTGPAVSPDNKLVAFVLRDPSSQIAQTDLYIVDLETGVTQNITQTSNLNESHPSWSPDGSHIVYQRADTIESGALREGELPNVNLYVMALDAEAPDGPTEPVEPPIEPPLPLPEIQASTSTVVFEATEAGSRSSRILTLRNSGLATLTIDGAQASPQFEALLPSFPLSIEPDQSAEITLIFAPTGFGDINGTQTFQTNDPTTPELSIALSGTGIEQIVPPPRITSLSPTHTTPGSELSILGNRFSLSDGENIVRVGNLDLHPADPTATELLVFLPNDLGPGNYPVQVLVGGRESNTLLLTIELPEPPLPPIQPQLFLERSSENQYVITWHDPSGLYTLETTNKLNEPIDWREAAPVFIGDDGMLRFEFNPSAPHAFFRLLLTSSNSDSGTTLSLSPPRIDLANDWQPEIPVLDDQTGTILPATGLNLDLPNGGTVSAPPNTTTTASTFRITELDLAPYHPLSRSVYQVETESQPLLKPITLRLPAPPKTEGDTDEIVVYRNHPNEEIEILPSSLDPTTGLVSFESDRFSTLILERQRSTRVPPTSSRTLEVPYYPQGDAWWCWAAASQMMFKYYGLDVEAWEVARYFEFGPDTGPTILRLWAGSYHRLFSAYGLAVEDVGMWASMDSIQSYLIEQIDQGHPVMMLVQNAVHAIVVTGYNRSGVFVNDPSGHSVATALGVEDPANFFFHLNDRFFTWDQFRTALFGRNIGGFDINVYLPVWTIRLDASPRPPSPALSASILGFKREDFSLTRLIRGTASQSIFTWDGRQPNGFHFKPNTQFGSPIYPVNDDQIFTLDLMLANPTSSELPVNFEVSLNGQTLPIKTTTKKIEAHSSYQKVELQHDGIGLLPFQESPSRVLTPGKQNLLISVKSRGKLVDWIPLPFETGPSVPTKLQAESSPEGIRLNWEPVPEAFNTEIEYDIFEGIIKIGDSALSNYLVSGGSTSRTYAVRSRHVPTGLFSATSASVSPAKPLSYKLAGGPVLSDISGTVTATTATALVGSNPQTVTWTTPPDTLKPNEEFIIDIVATSTGPNSFKYATQGSFRGISTPRGLIPGSVSAGAMINPAAPARSGLNKGSGRAGYSRVSFDDCPPDPQTLMFCYEPIRESHSETLRAPADDNEFWVVIAIGGHDSQTGLLDGLITWRYVADD